MGTHLSNLTFWTSFNVPFFPAIRSRTGYTIMEAEKGGEVYSLTKNIRALLFKAKQKSVQTLEDMKQVMQSNGFKKTEDALETTPDQAIASRFDLEGSEILKNLGAIDSKIVNYDLVKINHVLAISGPTHQEQQPFDWINDRENELHLGMPEKWDFPWVEFSPESLAE